MKASLETTQSNSVSKHLLQAARAHPLPAFFILAYAFSWIVSIPYILGQWGLLSGDFAVVFVIKSFGPFLAAYAMTYLLEGKEGAKRLRQSTRQARAGWAWYAFILLGIPALVMLGISLLPGALASFMGFPPHYLATFLVTFALIFFGGGPLGEEPGWRGFALPRLQARFGPLWGTLCLGVVWVFWHLPDFLTTAQRGGPGANPLTLIAINFPVFFVMVVSMAVVFTWVYNHTRGSVFIAILLHTSINAFGMLQALFSAPSMLNTDLFMCLPMAALALLIILLTRGKLGYQQLNQNDAPHHLTLGTAQQG